MTGYLSREYAESLGEWGSPLELPRCGGWLLARNVQAGARDAMGIYPRFCCRNWQHLGDDLQALAEMSQPLVSVALVTDPFADVNESQLREIFPDRCLAFKEHYVADLSQPSDEFVDSHHRYYVRWTSSRMTTEVCDDAAAFLDDWEALYAALAEKHHMTGMKRFSRTAFARQLATPGLVVLRAMAKGEVIGGQLWYVQGDVAYSHLTAVSNTGYRLRASYALYGLALEYFRSRVRWLDWGAGAGLQASADDSLAQFKRGWSNATRQVYFCGRVLDRTRYDELAASRAVGATNYFPAYRAGEFA